MRTAGRAGLLAALFLGAIALRPQIIGLGPVLPEIQDDLEISHAVAGLLATIPVLCMGVFAPSASYVAAHVGTRHAIAASLGLIGLFGLARLVVPAATATIALTVGVGIGIAFAGALLPVAVKERFADRPAFATGVYTTGINVGSAVSSAVAFPLAAAAGGWRSPFLAFSAFTLVLAGLWLYQTSREPPHLRGDARPPRLPVRSPVAWMLVAVFGLIGIIYYGLNSWLPDSYVERGWSEGTAAALPAVLNISAIPAGFAAAWAADRIGSRRLYLAVAGAAMAAGLLGVLLLPAGGWFWAALMGAANGVIFALIMTLPLDVADDPAQVGAVAGLMLGAGYCVAAGSPFVLGAVRDATGSFTASLWVAAGAAFLFLVIALLLNRERLHRGVRTDPAPAGRPAGG